ncbi:MAG TPA: asparagine synthase (glutamine-hydrolyzing) [Candidatus Sulfotelmatobacter sp.]|nr:asparagine synthase (glutamine-hydrolyzing) [Candidatus Sulfotelmatobacter sp.]
MCGICGVLNFDPAAPVDPAVLKGMADLLAHRGPDGEGFHRHGPIGLGHRRLAIIDLSDAAAQPMANEDESLWIVFNGEIYNFQSLRDDLLRRGHTFRSKSDTETILHLYEEEGEGCLRHLRGMFAFALWDSRRRRLFLARDRVGKKPLFYWHRPGRAFAFASEPKAFVADPAFRAEPDAEALWHFLTFQYIPAPWSGFRAVRKLPPAHYLVLEGDRLDIHRYWDLRYTPKRGESALALAAELGARLREAVRLRLISDVPLGAFLSGGVDSGAVVALMAEVGTGPLRTFSIGFPEADYDELRYARLVAERFQTEHHELVVRPDALAILPRMVWHYNEPFGDSSAVPSFYLAEMTRRGVTVALNGDGGDESFAGYPRYLALRRSRGFDYIPRGVRPGLAWAASHLPAGRAKGFLSRAAQFLAAQDPDPERRYARWLVHFDHALKPRLCTPEFQAQAGGADSVDLVVAAYARSDGTDLIDRTLHVDVQTYLPDDLLVKMDIATMAHSLEARSPFLDHELMEFAASLPPDLKLHGRTGKKVLKSLLRPLLPPALLHRPKMGFGVPIDHWFRGPLRDVLREVLLSSRCLGRGYLRPPMVQKMTEEHIAGRRNWHYHLWDLLVLELWFRTFIDQPRPTPLAAP